MTTKRKENEEKYEKPLFNNKKKKSNWIPARQNGKAFTWDHIRNNTKLSEISTKQLLSDFPYKLYTEVAQKGSKGTRQLDFPTK